MAEKKVSTSFWVHTAPKSWSKYTTNGPLAHFKNCISSTQIWYSFFVVAFALGFYIMLHRDTSYSEEKKVEEYPFFDDPFLSMIKTTTMFVGEIEFSNIPIEGPMLPLRYIWS